MSTPPGRNQSHIGDPYLVLGVPRGASRRQIAEAYRRLAKRHHPDVDPDPSAADRMRRINAAWRTLSDPRSPARHASEATSSAHWASARPTGRGAARASVSWAAWDSRTVHDHRFDPRRGPNSSSVRYPRRPPPPPQGEMRFQDTGWAALLAVGVVLIVLGAAAYAGSMSSPPQFT